MAAWATGRVEGSAPAPLEIGSIATFLVVTILAVTLSDAVAEQWILPLSIAGLLAVAVVAVVTGTPLLGPPVESGATTDETRDELFGEFGAQLGRVWLVGAAAMTVSSLIPPLTSSNATVATVFGWVLPFASFAAAVLVSYALERRVIARLASPETVRRTTFVAFRELAIDELYYLAREKAEREVGPGREAYDVKLGSSGISLTGDESRESWPATYKVRERR